MPRRFDVLLKLRFSVWQIGITEEDKQKTAFITPDRLYEFQRLLFDLVTAPNSFQHCMAQVLERFKWSRSLVYLDDVLVKGYSIENYL